MFYRWTVWESDRGEPYQISLALANDYWELVTEETRQVGPFDTAVEVREELLARGKAWLEHTGIQMDLPLG